LTNYSLKSIFVHYLTKTINFDVMPNTNMTHVTLNKKYILKMKNIKIKNKIKYIYIYIYIYIYHMEGFVN
jgi:hypothetical protein